MRDLRADSSFFFVLLILINLLSLAFWLFGFVPDELGLFVDFSVIERGLAWEAPLIAKEGIVPETPLALESPRITFLLIY